MSNYGGKNDLKRAAGIDMSNLVVRSDLPSLKAELYKRDVNKLKTVPVDLS